MTRWTSLLAVASLAVLCGVWFLLTAPAVESQSSALTSQAALLEDAAADPLARPDVALPRAASLPTANVAFPERHSEAMAHELQDRTLLDERKITASVTLHDTTDTPLSQGFLTAIGNDGTELATAHANDTGEITLRFALPDSFPGESRKLLFALGAPGHAETLAEYRSWVSPDSFDLGTVKLAEAHSVYGRLVSTSGQPHPDTSVGLRFTYQPSWKPSGARKYSARNTRVRTDANGEFHFLGLHRVAAAQLQALDERGRLKRIGQSLRSDGSHSHDAGDVVWNAPLARASMLRVRVVNASGDVIPSALASVQTLEKKWPDRNDPAGWLSAATSGAAASGNGWIMVREPPSTQQGERVGIALAAPGYLPKLLSFAEARDATHTLEQALALQLVITQSETQRPIEDLELSVKRESNGYGHASPWISLQRSEDVGTWSLRDPLDTPLRLELSAPYFGRRVVVLEAGLERRLVHEVVIPGPRRVRFQIVNQTGALRDDVLAILGGPISVDQQGLHRLTAQAQPDSSYVVFGATPGEHTLTFTSDGALPVEHSVTVGLAPSTDLGELHLDDFGSVRLSVVDAMGQPVEHKPKAEFPSNTDRHPDSVDKVDTGLFLYTELQPGLWHFTLEPGGDLEVNVQPGITHELEMQLAQWARIEGRVVREDGTPIAGANVMAFKSKPTAETLSSYELLSWSAQTTWASPGCTSKTTSDEFGNFVLQLPAHDTTHLLAVDSLANQSGFVKLSTQLGELRSVDLTITAGHAILEGVVRHEASGEPLANAIVVVAGVRVGQADAEGRFHIEGLPEGTVRLEAVHLEGHTFNEGLESVTLSSQTPTSVELRVPRVFQGSSCFLF